MFYLHTDLLLHHSKPLDCMMNGDMSEAQRGYAVLKEVEETFVPFAEWAYGSSSGRSVVEEDRSERRIESPRSAPQPTEELALGG